MIFIEIWDSLFIIQLSAAAAAAAAAPHLHAGVKVHCALLARAGLGLDAGPNLHFELRDPSAA